MADLLPAKTNGMGLSRAQELALNHLAGGMSVSEFVKAVSKGDVAKAKRWRQRLRSWATKPAFLEAYGQLVQGELVLGLLPAAEGIAARASRGRPDAAKLLFGATGFYQPGVKHDHSGEIKIKLEMPRPERTEDVVDAEVVEED